MRLRRQTELFYFGVRVIAHEGTTTLRICPRVHELTSVLAALRSWTLPTPKVAKVFNTRCRTSGRGKPSITCTLDLENWKSDGDDTDNDDGVGRMKVLDGVREAEEVGGNPINAERRPVLFFKMVRQWVVYSCVGS